MTRSARLTTAALVSLVLAVISVTAQTLTISPSEATLAIGQTLQLKASMANVTWSSSNPTIASVTATGVVSARAAGTATISATLSGQTPAQSVITVVSSGTPIVSPSALTMFVGGSVTLTASTVGATWTSSAPSIATVTAVGSGKTATVTGVAEGASTIEAKYKQYRGESAVEVLNTTEPPILRANCPTSNVTAISTTGNPVAVTYLISASGGLAPVTVTGTPASGSLFSVGTTAVNVAAHSSDGQDSTCSFNVVVTAQSSVTTFYVSTSGNDSNNGAVGTPFRTIQKGADVAEAAIVSGGQPTRVVIAAGTYRESVSVSKTVLPMLTIEGAGPTTILTGSDDLSTGWTLQGNGTYTHAWTNNYGAAAVPAGWSSYWATGGAGQTTLRNRLLRSETLYVNGTGLKVRLILSELSTPGTFYVDEAADLIHVRMPTGVVPGGGTVIETGVRINPLTIAGVTNMTLKNFAVMRSRGSVATTGFGITNSRNITLDGVTVKQMAYAGLGSAYNVDLFIYRSFFTQNGVLGMSDYNDRNVVFEDSEVSGNNWRGADSAHLGWDSGWKWSGVHTGVARRIKWINNFSSGFWADTNNKNVLVENSLMSGNTGKGVSLEKNDGPIIIRGNRICNNIEGGINDAQSDNITVENNHIFNNSNYLIGFGGNYLGQTEHDWETGISYTAHTVNWKFTGNTIAGSGTELYSQINGGWLWWHTNYNAPGAWEMIRNSLLAFNNNKWYHVHKAAPFKMPAGSITWAQFKADLQLKNATFENTSTWTLGAPPVPLVCALP